jgi:hypothetical protein
MLNPLSTPRHWSPQEGYATADVLLNTLDQGWELASLERASGFGPAVLHRATLRQGVEVMTLLVLDGPAIHDLMLRKTSLPA